MIPPPTVRSAPNSDEASKPLSVSCGTESSNPFPSSKESSANLVFDGNGFSERGVWKLSSAQPLPGRALRVRSDRAVAVARTRLVDQKETRRCRLKMLATTVASALPSLIHSPHHTAEGIALPTTLVPRWRWRWCRYCAGDRAKRAAGCCPDCSAGSAASRSADRRAGPRTDQAAADRSLAGVIGVCARRQTERQRQRNPARSNTKCLSHVLTVLQGTALTTQRDWVRFPCGLVNGDRDPPQPHRHARGVRKRPRGARTATQCYRRSRSSCCALGGGRKRRRSLLWSLVFITAVQDRPGSDPDPRGRNLPDLGRRRLIRQRRARATPRSYRGRAGLRTLWPRFA